MTITKKGMRLCFLFFAISVALHLPFQGLAEETICPLTGDPSRSQSCPRSSPVLKEIVKQASKNEVPRLVSGYFDPRISAARGEEEKDLILLKALFSAMTLPEIHRLSVLYGDGSEVELPAGPSPKEGSYTLAYEESSAIRKRLSHWRESLKISQRLTQDRIASEAKALLAVLKKQGSIGEIYDIAFNRYGVFLRLEAVEIPKEAQDRIDALFQNSTGLSTSQVLPAGKELMEQGKLTFEEMQELRDLRRSTSIFEKESFLAEDWGGWNGNFIGPFTGKRQTVCHEEAVTYRLFMEKLNERGLLRHFEAVGTASRTAHEATLLVNQRTKEQFVLDSWSTEGGDPAQIFTFEDWKKRRDSRELVAAD